MKALTSTVCILLLLACQSKKTSSEQVVDSTAADTTSALPESNSTSPEVVPYEETVSSSFSIIGTEVLIKPGVVVYPDTATTESMGERPALEKVTVISVTGLRYPEGEDLCNQYFWYEVRFAEDGASGWVSGEDVLLINVNDNAYVGELEFMVNPIRYFTPTTLALDRQTVMALPVATPILYPTFLIRETILFSSLTTLPL